MAFTASILLFCILIDLNEDGNTLGDNEEDMLRNAKLIVGSSVGTFNLKELCSRTRSSMFSALKLLRPAKALCLMFADWIFCILMVTVWDSTMGDFKEFWWKMRLSLLLTVRLCRLEETETASGWNSTWRTLLMWKLETGDSAVMASARRTSLGQFATRRCWSWLEPV